MMPVRIRETYACEPGYTCYSLRIDCPGLFRRAATVRASQPTAAIGTVIFATGGQGTGYYAGDLNPNMPESNTLLFLQERGFQTFEISWPGAEGWVTGNRGAGVLRLMEGIAEIVRWIVTVAQADDLVRAHGNSGGGGQFAYGLTSYGLEAVFDRVVLSGGPPFGDLEHVCYPDGGPTLIDQAQGWYPAPQHCHFGTGDQAIHATLQANSLVNPINPTTRLLEYPSTHVSFVQGELDTANIARGQVYYDAITSSKSWRVVSGVKHQVHRDLDGAVAIREELVG